MAVAYGDFSYNGRRPHVIFHKDRVFDTEYYNRTKAHHCQIWCEDDNGTDDFMHGVIENYRGFLGACPEDALLYKDNVPC